MPVFYHCFACKHDDNDQKFWIFIGDSYGIYAARALLLCILVINVRLSDRHNIESTINNNTHHVLMQLNMHYYVNLYTSVIMIN